MAQSRHHSAALDAPQASGQTGGNGGQKSGERCDRDPTPQRQPGLQGDQGRREQPTGRRHDASVES